MLQVRADLRRGADFSKHMHHFFVGAAVQGTFQRPDRRGHHRVGIGKGGPGDHPREGRGVHGVFCVKDQANIQRMAPYLLRDAVREHIEEVFAEVEIISWWNVVISSSESGVSSHDRGQLGYQSDGGPVVVVDVLYVPSRIEHPQGRHGSLERIHWMPLFWQTFEQIDDAILDPAMESNVTGESLELELGWKAAEQQERRCLQKGRPGTEVLDPDTSVFQNAALAVNIADRGPGCWHSSQPRHEVMWHLLTSCVGSILSRCQ